MRTPTYCLLTFSLLSWLTVQAQVKSQFLHNTGMPYGVLDIRTNISASEYYYLQEDITFSFRESAGAKTNTFHDMTTWDSSPYSEGNLRKMKGGTDSFVMNYRLLKPMNYDENFAHGYPIIILLHGAKERGNCYYEECYHADATYDPNINQPAAPTNSDHPLLNNDYHLAIGAQPHLKARNATAGKLPNDPSLPANAFPGFVLMPQMMNIWDSLNVQDVIRIVRLHCSQYNIDEDRIYIEGLSIGGYGVYEALKRASWLFAAAIPMSAVTEAANIFRHNQEDKVAHIPIWAFQGGKDKKPSPAFTEAVMEKFRDAGSLPKYTLYADAGHVVWGKVFAEPDLYQWLLSKKKSDIHIAYRFTEIDQAQNITPRLELAEGFLAYQWQKDGVVIDAASNHLTVTEPGEYRARFSRLSSTPAENQWNDWSAPVTITRLHTDEEDPDDGTGEEEQPDDGTGEEEQPDDGTGEEEQPDDGTGEEEQPDDGTGEEEQPDDGTGEEEQPDDGTGEEEQPDDGTGGEEQPDDGTGEEEQPDDGTGEEEQPDDGTGEEEQPDDGTGEEEQPDDGTGEEEQPDDGTGEEEQPDDGTGEEEQPDDGTGEEEQPDDGTGEEEQSDDGTGEEEQPDDGTGEEEQPDEGTGEVPADSVVTNIEEGFRDGISVYPNPNSGNTIFIEFDRKPGNINLAVHDAMGRPVFERRNISVEKHMAINISPRLPSGFYILIIRNDLVNQQRRLIIRN